MKKLITSYENLRRLHLDTTGFKLNFSEGSNFWFDLSCEVYYNFLKKTLNFRLPIIETVEILFVPPNDEWIKTFLLYSTPLKLKHFSFNYVMRNTIDWSKYLYQLMSVAMKTAEFFDIWNINISWIEFCKLVKAARNWNVVFFESCNIDIDKEWDFGQMKEWNIKKFGFQLTTKSSSNENINKFTNFLSGISKCNPIKK